MTAERTGFKGSTSACVVKLKPSRSGGEFHVGCWREKELQGFGPKQLAGKWGRLGCYWEFSSGSATSDISIRHPAEKWGKLEFRDEVQAGSRSMGFT